MGKLDFIRIKDLLLEHTIKTEKVSLTMGDSVSKSIFRQIITFIFK